ncbi:hypothetical protein [Olleya sp. R77988]|uniref:hypothetical protein n=1 Tax=Olleya sp. R77988 TaxID=3093875 RepID=UPI0037CAAAFE
MEQPNKIRLFALIKLPIIIVAFFVMRDDYYDIVLYFKEFDVMQNFSNLVSLIFTTQIVRWSAIMLIPLIGVFINKKVGWLFILSFYYLWIIYFIYFLFVAYKAQGKILSLGVIIVSLFFVAILNSYENSSATYKIKKEEQIKLNIAAFLIAAIEVALITSLNF